MSIYGIKVKGFEDPLFGFEDPLFGFEDPLFGYKEGELIANLANFVGKKAPATLKQDSDVLHMEVAKLDRPVRLVPENKDMAAGLYKLFAKGANVTFTVEEGGSRRDVAATIVLIGK
ncbi:MAG: hypothetical protein DHS20C20_26560 [Ardenticatenaceae bacterium]|nr:MAG: hypothetical protein DHS20C20_26560 [Ardenticatenaceae bacterium]